LQPTLDQYAQVRMLLITLGNQAGVPVTTQERALYLMSRAVQGKGMTWTEYGTAPAAVVPALGTRSAGQQTMTAPQTTSRKCPHQDPETDGPSPTDVRGHITARSRSRSHAPRPRFRCRILYG